jgi:hypothetical protein
MKSQYHNVKFSAISYVIMHCLASPDDVAPQSADGSIQTRRNPHTSSGTQLENNDVVLALDIDPTILVKQIVSEPDRRDAQ